MCGSPCLPPILGTGLSSENHTSFSLTGILRHHLSMDDSEQEDELATLTQQIAKLIAVTWQHISIPLTYQARECRRALQGTSGIVARADSLHVVFDGYRDAPLVPADHRSREAGTAADYGRASKERWPLVLGLESYFGNRSGATGRAGPIPENGREMAHMGSRRGTSLEGVGPGKRLSWFSRKHLSNHQPSVPHTIASLGQRVRQVFGGGRTPCRCTTGHPESPGEKRLKRLFEPSGSSDTLRVITENMSREWKRWRYSSVPMEHPRTLLASCGTGGGPVSLGGTETFPTKWLSTSRERRTASRQPTSREKSLSDVDC